MDYSPKTEVETRFQRHVTHSIWTDEDDLRFVRYINAFIANLTEIDRSQSLGKQRFDALLSLAQASYKGARRLSLFPLPHEGNA